MKSLASYVFLLFISSTATADDIDLKCQANTKEKETDLILTGEKIEFRIKNTQHTCESSFMYIPSSKDATRGIIIKWPEYENLGPQVHLSIFSALPKTSEAEEIGSVPVESNLTEAENGRFKQIPQEGGSIYETVYLVKDNRIEIESPNRELIIDDTTCVYNHESQAECTNMTGTFSKPICLHSYYGKKVLAAEEMCADQIIWEVP
jgi:hypothetical protein